MSRWPERLTQYLGDILQQRYRPAYLALDQEGVIEDLGGSLETYGFETLEAGTKAADSIDCLYGLLPVERSMSLRWVELPGGQVVDIHITDPAETTWVFFLDATREARIETRSLQAIHDANEIRETLADRIEVSPISPDSANLVARIMARLDTVILCYEETARLSLVGRPPQWFHEIYPKSLVRTEGLEPWSRFSFLSHFLDEALAFWSRQSKGSLRSGPWTELGWFGDELLLEARAILVQGTRLLLITRLDLEDPRVMIYRAREMALERTHRLREGALRTRALEAEVQEKEEALAAANQRLEQQNARLAMSRAKLRSLAYELAQAEERERRRIAQGLHDYIGQMLASIKIRLGIYRKSESGVEGREALDPIDQSLSEVIRYTRTLTFELGSPILYEIGFIAAVQDLMERTLTPHGIETEVVGHVDDSSWDGELKVVLFQAVRELLYNVVKHAEARRVIVRCAEEEGSIALRVEDDGRGFDVDRLRPERLQDRGFGLFSIQDRLDFFGGTFEAFSRPGEGTKITMRVPTPRGLSVDSRSRSR